MTGHPLARIIFLLGAFLLMVPALPAAAQATQDIRIWSYENDGSGPAYDACYELVGYSQVGCDENGDGAVLFQAVEYGTYTVRQVATMSGGRYVEDFTITVDGGISDFAAFVLGSAPARQPTAVPVAGKRDLYIATVADDASYYDACYMLLGYSQIGCDENRDGYVLFEDVDYGTYTVRQMADITPYAINDFAIEFNATTDNVFYAFLERDPNPVWTSDVHLITRDPKDGALLRGACYELVGYSNIGCDENNDGQVTFDDIPLGDYTLHQVTPPAGYTRIDDYTLQRLVVDAERLPRAGRAAGAEADRRHDGPRLAGVHGRDDGAARRLAGHLRRARRRLAGRLRRLAGRRADRLPCRRGWRVRPADSFPAGGLYPDLPGHRRLRLRHGHDLNTIWYVYLTRSSSEATVSRAGGQAATGPSSCPPNPHA